MVKQTSDTIDNLVNNLYTRYVLTRTSNGYYYNIDPTYSTNISYVGSDCVVKIYQIKVL
jgi:hypothetical protein